MAEDRNAMVYKSNALIQASYRLSLQEQRLMLSAISQVRRDDAPTDEVLYTITAGALAEVGGFSKSNAFRDMRTAAHRLLKREIWIQDAPNGQGRHKKTMVTRWVQTIVYLEEEGAVQLRFSKDVLPYLSQLKEQFTGYRLDAVSGMRSSYGVRLYELLMQWGAIGEREIEIEWLRDAFQLGEAHMRIGNLKSKVIEPAIRDINECSNLWVEWGQRKSGRRVTHLQFRFGQKEKAPSKSRKKLTDSEISKLARPGESWEEARKRLATGSQ